MCEGQALHVGLIDGVPKVWIRGGYGSHREEREHFGILDDAVWVKVAALEAIPAGDFYNPADWRVRFDENHAAPDWWTPECQQAAEREARAALAPVLESGKWPGSLYLRGLTSLPAGAKLSAGGSLDLRGLTSLGIDVTALRATTSAAWIKSQKRKP
jgi:hypothetical protein